ncbi:MAG: 2OG-Fe(II) oxygenase [Saprospiraceae bacterium]|nr:2OG-Fe(II) oxygenase [Saprospiraceae bacterium]
MTNTIATALNTDVINDNSIARFREEFSKGKPYKHIIIDNFLQEDVADALYKNFPKVTELRKHYKGINENKSEGSSFEEYDSRFPIVLEAIKSKEFTHWLEQVVQIDNLLLPDDHRGAGVHQGRNSSFLDVHVDFSVHPILNMHRRLNLLIFLNKNWKEEYGGLLELWNEDVTVLEKEVMPSYNRAVIFETTDTSYHGYDVITIPEDETRKSIYSYYYSPLAPGVKYHDTIFKPRPSDSLVKKTQTNAKELVKNGIKKTIQKLGLKGIFERFE